MKAYKRNGFYKNKFLLTVYDQEEKVIAVIDNPVELASLFNLPINKARAIVSYFFNGKQKHFYWNGRKFQLYFTELEPEDIVLFAGIN